MAVGHLALRLVASQDDLLGVDDDDVVAHVHVGGEGGLVLATQKNGGVRGEAAEDDVGGVDHEPLALGVTGLRGVSARHDSAAFLSNGGVRESRSGAVGGEGRTTQPVEGSRSRHTRERAPKSYLTGSGRRARTLTLPLTWEFSERCPPQWRT